MEKSFENSLKKLLLPNGETLAYRSLISTNLPQFNVILLHGWICSSFTIWDDFVALLSDLPINFYALDLRGFGDSTYNTSLYSIAEMAEDVNLFIKSMGLNKIVIGGYSMGGAVALQYAANYPESIEKLISFNGVGCQGVRIYIEENGKKIQASKIEDICKTDFWAPVVYKLNKDVAAGVAFETTGTYNCGKPIDPLRIERYIIEGLLKERHVGDVIYWLTRFNISKETNGVVEGNGLIEKIRCKCLFIHTDNDILLSAKEHAVYTANALGKELARVEIVENSGHCACMSNPEKTAEVVSKFLSEK